MEVDDGAVEVIIRPDWKCNVPVVTQSITADVIRVITVIFPFCRVCELVGVARAVRGADVVVAIGSVAAALWLFLKDGLTKK